MAIRWQTEATAETTFLGWGAFFLDRLEHLSQLRQTTSLGDAADRLLRRVTYITYLDCREHGVGEQARDVLLRDEPNHAETPRSFEESRATEPGQADWFPGHEQRHETF